MQADLITFPSFLVRLIGHGLKACFIYYVYFSSCVKHEDYLIPDTNMARSRNLYLLIVIIYLKI